MANTIVEFRAKRDSPWQRSYMPWTGADVRFFNKACGYEKYRERYIA
jgi:hypothetical protein